MPDAYGVRCRFPPHPLDVPPLFAFEGDASAALSVLLLARRPAYSALACCATIFAVDRLSAAPWMAGLLQARISTSGVNLCSTTKQTASWRPRTLPLTFPWLVEAMAAPYDARDGRAWSSVRLISVCYVLTLGVVSIFC